MKKKIIIILIFLALIAITSFVFIKCAIDSYNYDMDPANGIDILEGIGAGIAIAIGLIAVWVESDLFFTVYYFLVKPKTLSRSIVMILSQLMILLVLFSDKLAHFLFEHVSDVFREDVIVVIPIFFLYVLSRIICISICFSKTE